MYDIIYTHILGAQRRQLGDLALAGEDGGAEPKTQATNNKQ